MKNLLIQKTRILTIPQLKAMESKINTAVLLPIIFIVITILFNYKTTIAIPTNHDCIETYRINTDQQLEALSRYQESMIALGLKINRRKNSHIQFNN